MKIKLLGFSIPFVLLVAIAVQPARAAQALTKVTMTTGSFSEREAAMFVAQDQGFFRRYGLEAHLEDSGRRHFIKRFYGTYPQPAACLSLPSARHSIDLAAAR